MSEVGFTASSVKRRQPVRKLTPAVWFAAGMGLVGTALQLVALYVGPIAGDYPRGFWLEVVGSIMGSWSWRIFKTAR